VVVKGKRRKERICCHRPMKKYPQPRTLPNHSELKLVFYVTDLLSK
jgi:hypothetical protein